MLYLSVGVRGGGLGVDAEAEERSEGNEPRGPDGSRTIFLVG